MGIRNGYFQIIIKEDGTYLHLFPPVEGGLPVSMRELENYLYLKKIDYDKVPLFSAVNENADRIIKINGSRNYAISEMLSLFVSEDKMTVTGRFYPPSEGGDTVTADEIKKDLLYQKIKAEPDMAAIESFLRDRKYCTDYILAAGKPVIQGQDGTVEYLFSTDNSVKPRVNDDGTVDFHELNTVRACTAGQVLARLEKEVPGQYGINVFGEYLKPRDVKKAVFHHGRDITVSEDGTELLSGINGHVSLVNGTVEVSGLLEIVNVDVSTGNIRYEGNLVINGNVTTGYEVCASGDIEIRGIVESAVVEAGGQITIAKGMNGMGKGRLKAGSNIIAKYINGATAAAGGYVHSECIINSYVSAGDRVTVEGKKGFITGGNVRAGNTVEAKTIGSDMGVDTMIEVGVDPQLKARFAKLQKENAEIDKNVSRMEPVLMAVGQKLQRGEKISPDQIKKMQELSQNISLQKETRRKNLDELGQLSLQFDSETQAQVIVHGETYPGTRIEISESVMILKTQYHYCRFIKESGDVKMTGI